MPQSNGKSPHGPHGGGLLSLFNGATSTDPAGTLSLAAVAERIGTDSDLAAATANVRALSGKAQDLSLIHI